MPQETRTYCLVIKRNTNDFLPVEWNLTKFYQGENLYTLEGIDAFTSKISRSELADEIIKQNLASPDERFQSFAIIFKSKKRTRELKEGVIFKEDNAVLSEEDLISYIIENQTNKQLLNEIFNLCHFKDNDEKVKQFKFVLKNLELFRAKGENGIKGALSIFKSISYSKKRTIILRVVDNIILKPEKQTKLELKNAA